MRDVTAGQAAELAKYAAVYRNPDYRTGPGRLAAFVRALRERPDLAGAGLLDVGCGRGEALDAAAAEGYAPLAGTEVVADLVRPPRVVYALAWALPWPHRAVGTVACLDVLEHLLPSDEVATLAELGRVAGRRVLVTIGLHPSASWGVGELHVNLKPEGAWDAALRAAWGPDGWTVTRRPDLDADGINAAWEATR